MAILFQFNNELFKISGFLTLVLFALETGKDGFVSFFFNPVWVLLIFICSALIWLFTPAKLD